MIVSLSAAILALQGDFDAQIAVPNTLPVAWPNAPFDTDAQTGLWAEFSVQRSSDDEQLDVGAAVREYRATGVLYVVLYCPPNTGTNAALVLAEQIAARYRTVEIAGLSFDTPTVEPGARSGPWWRTTVRCPFDALYAA